MLLLAFLYTRAQFPGESKMQSQSAWLIKTKLLIPKLGDDALARPRLMHLLHQQPQRALTLICAPAGMGKTTVVLQWLQGVKTAVAWYSLEGGSTDLMTFLAYVIEAVQSVFPRACASLQVMTMASVRPPTEQLAAQLINDLAELPEPLILVLDDYHSVHDMEVHSLVGRLLEHLPHQVQLVITARAEPPLPLSALRARGRMVEIRSADLRFAAPEMRDFVEKSSGRTLPEAALLAIYARTEGWGAGLRMVALSLAATENTQEVADMAARLDQTQQHALDYLMDQVLASQSDEVLRFLLNSAIVERFSAPLCAAMLWPAEEPPAKCNAEVNLAKVSHGALEQATRILETILRANLFVIPLDAQGEWFRYHALFRDLLLLRLKATTQPEEVARLHSRAAAWLDCSGYVDEAIDHALASGDLDAAAQYVEHSVPAMLNRMDRPLLERVLGRLPAALIEKRPALLLARAWSYSFFGRVDGIQALVEKASALIPNAPPAQQQVLRAQISTLHSLRFWTQLQPLAAVEAAQNALAGLPADYKFARGLAHIYLSGGLEMMDRRPESDAITDAALAANDTEFDAYTIRLLMAKALSRFNSADLEQAAQWGGILLERARSHGYPLTTAWGHYTPGMVAHERWQTQAAIQHFSAMVELSYAAHIRCVVDSHLALAVIYSLLGQPKRSDQYLAAIEELSGRNNLYLMMEQVKSCRGRVALNCGDVGLALRHISALGGLSTPTTVLFQFEAPQLTAARVLIAAGGATRLAQARLLLDGLTSHIQQTRLQRWSADVEMARAHLLLKQGRDDAAFETAKRAVLLCEGEDYLRPLVEQGGAIQPLLRQLLAQGVAGDLIARALAAIPGGIADAPPAAARLVEPLTNREMDVMELLVDRLTNKEIANTLGVSASTIQTHLNNLYQKLNAENRRDAVVKAREFGIVA